VPELFFDTTPRLHAYDASTHDQSELRAIISLIFSMARDGARPLGQTSVQFMIVRQRNNR
jgi:hypothetical protein